MLYLDRNAGQRIVIDLGGELVTILVMDVKCKKGDSPRVRLGVQAPRSVPISRNEPRGAGK